MKLSETPWTRHDQAVHDANDRLVAMCFGGTPEEAEENAQLASVAPEMLDAIEDAMWLIECYVSNLANNEEYQELHRVSRKARG